MSLAGYSGHPCKLFAGGLQVVYRLFAVRPVPDPLKGTKGTGLRPRASGGLAPRSSAGAPWGPHWTSKVLRAGKSKNKEGRRKIEKKREKTERKY